MNLKNDPSDLSRPLGFKSGDVGYRFSTISKDGVLLMQSDVTGAQAQGLMSLDDIIVQDPGAAEKSVVALPPEPIKESRDFRCGFVATAAASALTCGLMIAGGSAAMATLLLPAFGLIGALSCMPSLPTPASKKTMLASTGLCASAFGMGVGLLPFSGLGGVLLVAGAGTVAVTTLLGGMQMGLSTEASGISSVRKLVTGGVLGCLAGAALSAFTAVALSDPAAEFCTPARDATHPMGAAAAECDFSVQTLKRRVQIHNEFLVPRS
ncbi:hypothetical protein [Micavibrio aeruginosavorus]|uniref:hypothetical protein n=1 Tax=Micavibrio aeruginosavorus TaxID=349221 RepID=UPI003F4A9CB1